MTQNERKHGMRKQEAAAQVLARYVELIEQSYPELLEPIERIVRACCKEVQTVLFTYVLDRADRFKAAQGDDAVEEVSAHD